MKRLRRNIFSTCPSSARTWVRGLAKSWCLTPPKGPLHQTLDQSLPRTSRPTLAGPLLRCSYNALTCCWIRHRRNSPRAPSTYSTTASVGALPAACSASLIRAEVSSRASARAAPVIVTCSCGKRTYCSWRARTQTLSSWQESRSPTKTSCAFFFPSRAAPSKHTSRTRQVARSRWRGPSRRAIHWQRCCPPSRMYTPGISSTLTSRRRTCCSNGGRRDVLVGGAFCSRTSVNQCWMIRRAAASSPWRTSLRTGPSTPPPARTGRRSCTSV